MCVSIEQLASEWQHGQRSKSSIKREFGYDTLKKVNSHLNQERENSRVENPAFEEEVNCDENETFCSHCDELLTEVGEKDRGMCESCQAKKEKSDWYDETEKACKELAEEFGFSFRQTGGWGKSSQYYELVFVTEDSEEYHEINLRISDHGVLYCKGNDISIAMNPNPDDHTIEDLRSRMESITK